MSRRAWVGWGSLVAVALVALLWARFWKTPGPATKDSPNAAGRFGLGSSAPQVSEWVEENPLREFRPPYDPPQQPEPPEKPLPRTEPVKLAPLVISFRPSAAPEEPETAQKIDAPPPVLFSPRGTLIRCELINAVHTGSLLTPVIGLVSEDVWQNAKRVVPAGTEVHGFARSSRTRDRIDVSGNWVLVWDDGREFEVQGLALHRQYNPESDRYGPLDGSAGIKGEVRQASELTELKLFAGTAVAAAARASQSSSGLLGISRREGLGNAGLEGMSSVAERYAQLLLDDIRGDGVFVHVPAGTQFYLYTLATIKPEEAQVDPDESVGMKSLSLSTPAGRPQEPRSGSGSSESFPGKEELLQRREFLLRELNTLTPPPKT